MHLGSMSVGNYAYIIVRTKSQPRWLNLLHLPILPSPATAKERVVIIGDQFEEGINAYGSRDFEKRKVLRREWKTPGKTKNVNNRERNSQWRSLTAQFYFRLPFRSKRPSAIIALFVSAKL